MALTSETVDREVLTVPEAGRVLGLKVHTAYRAARNGEIPTIRIGRRIRVPKAQLQRMLAGEQVGGAGV